MKKILSLLTAVILCAALCQPVLAGEDAAAAQNTETEVTVAAMQGPTGMGMAYLNKMSDEGTSEYKYDITYASSPDEITGELISGNIDIAAVPVNLASVLYNKTEGQILTAAVNTLGVLYIVESGDTVNSLADLAGKKVVASGKGSTPEYIFNYLLEKNGLTDQVEVEYVAEHDEAVTALANGTADIILIPEPKVTAALSQIEGARIAVDITEEWNKVYADDDAENAPQLVQGVIVVQKAFAEEHPEIVESFLNEYAQSVEYTNTNMEDASEIIASYGIVAKAAIALKALPNCHIVCLTGDEMKSAVTEMLTVLYEANPQSIGGTLNGDEMFYTAE
jgi:NitT/TauT family transport system substrate-binding protein